MQWFGKKSAHIIKGGVVDEGVCGGVEYFDTVDTVELDLESDADIFFTAFIYFFVFFKKKFCLYYLTFLK